MGALVKMAVLGLLFCAEPIVCMDSEQLSLNYNRQNQHYTKTKDAVELTFWGIASCAAYRFCKDRHKTKDTVAESTPAQTEIASCQSPGSGLTKALSFQGIVYTKSKDKCRLTTTKPKACAVPLAIIVPLSPVSSIRLCNSRPTPRILADGKFRFW